MLRFFVPAFYDFVGVWWQFAIFHSMAVRRVFCSSGSLFIEMPHFMRLFLRDSH